MSSILAVYDIPDALRVPNPSAKFRRYGFRVNLSCWVFPQHAVPSDEIETLRYKGAVVHMIEFAEKDQEKILDLARQELNRHAKAIAKFVHEKCVQITDDLQPERDESDESEASYKKWRGVISKGKRELLAAENCAFGFGITRDVEDALAALKNVLSAELELALSFASQRKEKRKAVLEVSNGQVQN